MYDKSGFILTLFILVHCAVCEMKRTVYISLQRINFHHAQTGTRIKQMNIAQVIVAANLLLQLMFHLLQTNTLLPVIFRRQASD